MAGEFLFTQMTLEGGTQTMEFYYIHEGFAKSNETHSFLHHEYKAKQRPGK